MKNTEEVYDFMIEHKIGTSYASTWEQIAHHFEFEELNFRYADKVYRLATKQLQDKELLNTRAHYQRFKVRMDDRVEHNISKKVQKAFAVEFKERD